MKIKVRAWDNESNLMVYSDHRTRKLYDVYYGFEMNGQGELECRWEGEFTESHVLDGGTLDNIMQYTGLKDKNGVEIYEGDIVRVFQPFSVPTKAIVELSDGCFELKGIELTWRDYVKCFVVNHAIEILGNIYKNHELLEERVEINE